MRRIALSGLVMALVFLSGAVGAWAAAQGEAPTSYVSLQLVPSMAVPLGESASLFGISGGGGIAAEFRMPFLPVLSLDTALGYIYYPMLNATAPEQSLSIFSASGGLGLQFSLAPWLALKGFFNGGYSYGFSNDFTTLQLGGSAFMEAGARLLFNLGPVFSLGVGASYRYSFGLFQGLDVSLGTVFRFPAAAATGQVQTIQTPTVKPTPLEQKGTGVELQDVQFSDIFPVFHKYYDDHPLGSAVLHNASNLPATDIKLTLDIKPYMSAPKTCASGQQLQPGDSLTVDLTALFTEKEILDVTEGTKASATLTWEYTMNGQKRSENVVQTVRLLNRNAMTWDDDRRAAAFITALDPTVLTFQKNVLGMVNTKSAGATNAKILSAIALYEAVCQYGVGYAVDPKSSYAQATADRTAPDFLQFPRQTFEYKGGDCDDLTILFSALFESAGIDTAFITIPGHIFMAIDLGIPQDEARATIHPPDDLIYALDKAWLPIEVTSLNGKFIEAWQSGAKEWREAEAQQLANLYSTHDAWAIYEPVGLVGGTFQIVVPQKTGIVAAYQREMERFVNQQIYAEVATLQADIQKTQKSPKSVNKLGVLYARYGLTDLAEKQFLDAISKQEYVPALMNLGNLEYIRSDLKKAQAYYERAVRKSPDDPKSLVSLARIYHDTENYGLVKELYDKVKELDPDLAQQFAYLELRGQESTRAADISGMREVMVWGEE